MEIEEFSFELPHGRISMEKDIKFFIKFFGKYGLDIFEEFHIFLTCLNEFSNSHQQNELNVVNVRIDDSISKQRLLSRNNVKYPKVLLFFKNILLNPSLYPDLIKWYNREENNFGLFNLKKLLKFEESFLITLI